MDIYPRNKEIGDVPASDWSATLAGKAVDLDRLRTSPLRSASEPIIDIEPFSSDYFYPPQEQPQEEVPNPMDFQGHLANILGSAEK